MESIFSVLLGVILAWTILMYFPVRRAKVSYYTLNPWPLELDNSNLALVGVGLASPKPKTSVMDASPASSAQPVMMEQVLPATTSPSPMPVISGPVTMSPGPVTRGPVPSA